MTKLKFYDLPPPPGVSRIHDFFLEQGEFADEQARDAVWEDIVHGAVARQHAVMKKAGGLPPEWEENLKQALREKEARRAARKQSEK